MSEDELESEFSDIVEPGFYQLPGEYIDRVAGMLRDLRRFNLRVERVQTGETGSQEVFFRGWFRSGEADEAYRITQSHGFNGGVDRDE